MIWDESSSRSNLLFEHDLRANAFRVCREGKPVSTFPDHAPGHLKRRHSAIWRLISAGAGIFHRTPVHHGETVAELAGKVEILFDQDDGDVAEAAQIGDRPPDILDDRRLDALGRL